MNKFLIPSLLFILIILVNSCVNLFETNSVLSIVENSDTWIGSTIYIRADGRIDPPNAPIVTVDNVTYVVVKNINITRGDGIVIERSNIILDGNKHVIHGPGGFTTIGVKIRRGGNITIRNLIITNFFRGLFIYYTSNITVVNNTISNNHGFHVEITGLASNITISHNIIKNTIYGSISYGVSISEARGVSILNNVFINTGLFVSGSRGVTVQNNTVNGKPLIYYEDALNIIINGEAGQVIINRGKNIVITGLNISYVPVGIQLVNTENSFVIRNNLVNNFFSIYLERSKYITVANNYIDGGDSDIYTPSVGVFVKDSDYTNISNNVIKNYFNGVYLLCSINNSIISNVFINCGLYLEQSRDNNVVDNTVNNKPLVYLENARNIEITGVVGQLIINGGINVTIRDLDISRTTVGIYLGGVEKARVMKNRISNNTFGLMLIGLSNCVIINNTIEYNSRGIDMIWSRDNMFIGNNIRYNNVGLYVGESKNNVFLYNNFINNTIQIEQYGIGSNTWDDGRIGNHWSDHECIDNDDNGVCENPYVIKEPDNVDRYPSKNPFYEIPARLSTTETLLSIPTSTSPHEESTTMNRRGENNFLTYLVLAIVFTVIVIVVVIVMKKH